MIDYYGVINEAGEEVKVKLIMRFKVEELGKEYIVYTLNDDQKSEEVLTTIAGIEEKDGKIELKLIPYEERNLVLSFYDHIRDTICGLR